jgi:hypothetical protein
MVTVVEHCEVDPLWYRTSTTDIHLGRLDYTQKDILVMNITVAGDMYQLNELVEIARNELLVRVSTLMIFTRFLSNELH